jgi:hypothetical protein
MPLSRERHLPTAIRYDLLAPLVGWSGVMLIQPSPCHRLTE